MSESVPILSVIGVGVAFAVLVLVRPRRWLRLLSALLLAVLFGFGTLVAMLPIVQENGSSDPFLPLTVGMAAGDVAFAVGVVIALTLPDRAARQG